jgi:phage terminase large subunit-like protein
MDAAISGDTFALVGVGRYGAQSDQMLALRMVRVWEPNGTPLDYSQIEQDIRAIIREYNVVQIAYDPYQAHYLAQRLSDVVWCEPFSQQARRLESDAALRQLIMTRRLVHNGEHTIVRQHLMNANAKVDETGHRLRIVKRDTSNKIDSVVALSMAAHAALGLNLY